MMSIIPDSINDVLTLSVGVLSIGNLTWLFLSRGTQVMREEIKNIKETLRTLELAVQRDRVEIAETYVRIEVLQQTENRLLDAIRQLTESVNRLTSRIDRRIDQDVVRSDA